MKNLGVFTLAAAVVLFGAGASLAEEIKTEMKLISADGIGDLAGTITAKDSDKGLVLAVDVKGLKPGPHGMHMHEKASCDAAEKDGKKAAGLAAGGHFDPEGSKHHMGPDGTGHKGDLPLLTVADDGSAKIEVVASRLKLADLKGHALMIHEGGDNYTDEPANGGGGARIACGVMP